MFSFLKKKSEPVTELKAYISGEAIKIEDVKDGVFSEKILGDGMAIIPSDEVVTAPCAAEVCSVADTKHAVGLQLENGLQLLIHIGLDTVSMNGAGFQVFVKEGQKVKAGEKLVSFDKKMIKEAGFPDTVIFVVLENSAELPLNFQYGMVQKNESVIMKL